jgi:hypothetical protein
MLAEFTAPWFIARHFLQYESYITSINFSVNDTRESFNVFSIRAMLGLQARSSRARRQRRMKYARIRYLHGA